MGTVKKYLFSAILVLCLGFTTDSIGQDTRPSRVKSDFVDRLRFGGYVGLQFGTITAIDVSPMIIYKANEWLYPGIGFSYMYYKDKRFTPEYSSSYYGPKVFVSAYVWRDLYAHAEYEALNLEYWDRPGERGFIHSIMLGAGYRQWIGSRAFVMFTVLYNFNESIYSPYSNPIIRIGFGVGI